MGATFEVEFPVTVGNISTFGSADRLATHAGLLPTARDYTAGCEEGTSSSK
jgi:hypothetical protein